MSEKEEEAMITNDAIKQLRQRINKNNYILNKYSDTNGKNQWSRICSATDWITVAVAYLEENAVPQWHNNDNLYSINVFTYISCVDMVFEAVKQLYQVFIEPENTPFYGEKGIFRDNKGRKDDNSYFKLIRACFGAHPVDLNDYFSSDSKTEKRFASWSGQFASYRDYGVVLYSIIPNGESLFFDISFREINTFLERTYGYLYDLIDVIENDERNFIAEQKHKPIPKSLDDYEQLCILENENELRFKSVGYDYDIQRLKILFRTPISNPQNMPAINQFKHIARRTISEIYDVFQNMKYDDWKTPEAFELGTGVLPHSVHAGLIEISDMVYSGGYTPIIFLRSLLEYVSPYVFIDGSEPIEEQYVLALAGLYCRSSNIKGI